MNMARKQHPAGLQLSDSPHFRATRAREAMIEARLHATTRFVESFGCAAYTALLSERESTREAVEELCVKESALRWILRVAKYSDGRVRERLWTDIEQAVTGLEKLAECIIRWAEVLPFRGSAAARCEAAGNVHVC